MNTLHVKKGDTVLVISGKDKGKKGKVMIAMPKTQKVIVEGINISSKHKKPAREGEIGGIIKAESPIYACKVMNVCPKCSKPTRIGHTIEGGKKQRVCKQCGQAFN